MTPRCSVCGVGIPPLTRYCSAACHRADCPEDYEPEDYERDDEIGR